MAKKRHKPMKKHTFSQQDLQGCLYLCLLFIMVAFLSALYHLFQLSPKGAVLFIVLTVVFVCVSLWVCKRIKKILKTSKYQRLAQLDTSRMTGIQYERYAASKLASMGYRIIKLTKTSGDQGVDIIAKNPDGITCAIQCKRYSKPVGNKAIQEAYSGAAFYGCKIAIVVTNSTFTNQAIEAALRLGVKLYDCF